MGQTNCQCQFNNIIEEGDTKFEQYPSQQTSQNNHHNHHLPNANNYQSNKKNPHGTKKNRIVPKLINSSAHSSEAGVKTNYLPSTYRGEIQLKQNIDQVKELDNNSNYSLVVLKNQFVYFDLKAEDSQVLTFGTTSCCDRRLTLLSHKNPFKIQVQSKNGNVTMKDCGVGLGAFVLRKKIQWKSDHSQLLINFEEYFVMIKIKPSSELQFKAWSADNSFEGTIAKGQIDKHIQVTENESLTIQAATSSLKEMVQSMKQYVIRLSSRRHFWVYLNEEVRIRERERLRLGEETFEVQSISKHMQDSGLMNK